MKCPDCHAEISHLANGSISCPYCGYQDYLSNNQPSHKHLGRHALLQNEPEPIHHAVVAPKPHHRYKKHVHKASVAAICLATAVSALLVASAFRTPHIKTASVAKGNVIGKQIAKQPTEPATTDIVQTAPAPTPTPVPAQTSTPTPAPAKTTTPPVVATTPAPAPVVAPPPVVQPTIPAPPSCIKTTFPATTALTISTASPGLKKTVEAPKYYRVYGYTADQVRSQLNQCRPLSGGPQSAYDATANWWINYNYLYGSDGKGKCYVHNATVGVHVTESLPQWLPSAYDASGLAYKWQTYLTNLKTHEQGHIDLDVSYASQLLTGLQTLAHSSCTTIVKTANKFADDKITALKTANTTYDTQNNHGVTQGAIFP